MLTARVSGSTGWTNFAFASLLVGAALLGSTGCSSPDPGSDGNTTTTSSTASDTAETGSTTVDTSDSTTETSTETDTSDATTDDSASSGSFYAVPQDIVSTNDCDPWAQDCPEGEKCVPYASTGNTWDANKCVPLIGDGAPGDPCTSSGIIEATDDCDLDGICWNTELVDGQLVGTCTEFCTGTPDAPICAEFETCVIANQGSINLCIESCDPLAQDCSDGQACYWTSEDFACLPVGDSTLGDECINFNSCAPGSLCLLADAVPSCMGIACCTQLCSLGDPVCDELGTSCVALFEDPPPPDYADLGICI